MITYSKTAWGLHLMCRLYGSALLRVLPFALLSGAMTALLYVYWGSGDKASWRHPYPYALSAFIVGFAVVFRSNFGYARYWEGRTHLQEMTGRWADAYTEAVIFNTGREGADPERTMEFKETMLHLMSLMHALAVQHLRGDWELLNLHPTHPADQPPPVDAASLQYIIGPPMRSDGSWRLPLLDMFMLRGTENKRRRFNRAMPIGVVGGVSAQEAQTLGVQMQQFEEQKAETATFGGEFGTGQGCASFFGLSTGMYVPGAAERVNMVYSWVLQLLQQRGMEGELVAPAPIAANMFHMLSQGLIAFENCRKLTDTPFPFPWAQAVLFLLLIYSYTAPLLIVAFVDHLWLAVLLDIVSVQTYWALNEVARDLEDPFVYEPNDLPLARIQYQFNERLKAASSTERPPFYGKGRLYMSNGDSKSPTAEPAPSVVMDMSGWEHPSAKLTANRRSHLEQGRPSPKVVI